MAMKVFSRLVRWFARNRGSPSVTDATSIRGRVDIRVQDVRRARAIQPNFDSLSPLHKQWVLSFVPSERREQTFNTTVDGLHEYIVDNLDQNQNTDEDISHCAVGTDDTAATTGDSALGNEVERTILTTADDQTDDLFTSTLFDSTQANGNTLREVALFTASSGGIMMNRSVINDVVKDQTKTVTVDITLKFRSDPNDA